MITALCLHLGRTRAELRATMSSQELGQWMAIYRREPFGLRHLYDLPQALIRASLFAVHGKSTNPAELLVSELVKPAATLEAYVAEKKLDKPA